MEMTSEGWGYLCDKSSKERKKVLENYAKQYLVPMFDRYPELKGKVYLALRKKGFIAEYKPVYHIIVPEKPMKNYSEWWLRSITAHELFHLIQFSNGLGINDGNNLKIELQATFMAFARGYAYDFLKAFPTGCNKEVCDMEEKRGYFKCGHIFSKTCKELGEEELKNMADRLYVLASQYTLWDSPDYINIVKECLQGH